MSPRAHWMSLRSMSGSLCIVHTFSTTVINPFCLLSCLAYIISLSIKERKRSYISEINHTSILRYHANNSNS